MSTQSQSLTGVGNAVFLEHRGDEFLVQVRERERRDQRDTPLLLLLENDLGGLLVQPNAKA